MIASATDRRPAVVAFDVIENIVLAGIARAGT